MADALWTIILAQEEASKALLATIAARKGIDREKLTEAQRLMDQAWKLVVEGMVN